MNSPEITEPFDPPPPEGYRAVDHTPSPSCKRCAFNEFSIENAGMCLGNPCTSIERPDGRYVFFVKKQA